MLKKILVYVLVVIILLSLAGCGSDETEAEVIVGEFITDLTGIELKSIGHHDLKTREIGLQVEEVKYSVIGDYVTKEGKKIFVKAAVERVKDGERDGWVLESLSIDSERIYEK